MWPMSLSIRMAMCADLPVVGLASGAWDYEQLHNELLDNILTVDCPQMDEIATVEEVKNGFWGMNGRPGWFF